jgi:hypothetical protein
MSIIPAFVEVFGDDCELHPILIEDASDEALEDGIAVLEQRRLAVEADIRGLRELLAQRRGEPIERSPHEIREESRHQSIEGLLKFAQERKR